MAGSVIHLIRRLSTSTLIVTIIIIVITFFFFIIAAVVFIIAIAITNLVQITGAIGTASRIPEITIGIIRASWVGGGSSFSWIAAATVRTGVRALGALTIVRRVSDRNAAVDRSGSTATSISVLIVA